MNNFKTQLEEIEKEIEELIAWAEEMEEPPQIYSDWEILNKRKSQLLKDEEIHKQETKEFIEKLKEKIRIQGNLSNRIIKIGEDEYKPVHDSILNNIVIELIDELSEEMIGK